MSLHPAHLYCQPYIAKRIINHDGNNIMFMMPTTDIAGQNNIYANAPPKPPRYQYYDANQVVPSPQSYYSHLPVPHQSGLKRIAQPTLSYSLARNMPPLAQSVNQYQPNHQQQQQRQQQQQQQRQINNAHFGYNHLAQQAQQAKPFFGSQYNLAGTSFGHVGFAHRSVDLTNMGSTHRLNYGSDIHHSHPSHKYMDICHPSQTLMRDRNSQLIVDLTTPRVLAKTQTTISSASTSHSSSSSSSTASSRAQPRKLSPGWPPSSSINQVGLPDMNSAPSFNRTMSMSMLENMTLPPVGSTLRPNSYKVDKSNGLTYIEQGTNNNSGSMSSSSNNNTAPYYYSDLKSEEQREALQSIVQHKSLSPPPKLLSRSTDQSITRLTLKSATLHPNRPQVSYESLASTLRPAKSFTVVNDGFYGAKLNSFSSSADIAGAVDKMFGMDYPTRTRNVNNGFNSVLGNVIDVDNMRVT